MKIKLVDFFYNTLPGRLILKLIMELHLDRIAVWFLCSFLSKPVISIYADKTGIGSVKKENFRSFREFFIRSRENEEIDKIPGHLISPCDGWLSVFSIDERSCFSIKNSYYRLEDFLQDEDLAENYRKGSCMIFRLEASDYHHYCYIDDGFQGRHHMIPGVLHSVQPAACDKFPVYVINKRCWSLLTTEHFGPVVQCEIGALIVGGIYNEKETGRFCKGEEKGHFELAGSTIVLLFEDGQVELNSEIKEMLTERDEVRVNKGECVGVSERWIHKQ